MSKKTAPEHHQAIFIFLAQKVKPIPTYTIKKCHLPTRHFMHQVGRGTFVTSLPSRAIMTFYR